MALDSKQVNRAARKLVKSLKKPRKHPSPKQVHALRTNIRHLETAVEAILSKTKHRERSLLRNLRQIRKAAGKVRDMDVFTGDAVSIRLAPTEEENMIELLHYLGARRYKQAKRLCRLVEKRGSHLARRIKRLAARVRDRMPDPDKSQITPAVRQAVTTTVELFADLRRPARLNPRNLHAYRLKVKRLRDVVRLADRPVHPGLVESLGAVKDAIGDWHDWEELVSIALRVGKRQSNSLLRKLKQTSARKYSHALSTASHMRQKFLRSKRGGLRQSLSRTTTAMAS